MATIRTAIQIQDGMTPAMKAMTVSTNNLINSFEALQATTRNSVDTEHFNAVQSAISRINANVNSTENEIRQANEEAKKMPGAFSGTDAIISKLKTAAAGVGLAFGANKVIELADTMTSTTARLNLMNDGLQTTKELQDMIAASANRSRSAYQSTVETVAKLGILAGDSFSGNKEMIAFTELMNKNFVIGGTSIQEQTAAMYQLTQAMAAGKLQGDEFRSIRENAPLLAKAIEDYMTNVVKAEGTMKDWSSQGMITADVIKGAMFASANDINAKFAEMPMTFGQVGTVLGNTLLQAFQPVIQGIGKGSQWIYDNWSTLAPVFLGAASALGIFAIAMGVSNAVTWIGIQANRDLAIAMMKNPYMWIAMAIGVLVGIIYKWVQSVGGIKVAWLTVMDAIITATDNVRIAVWTSLEGMINGAIKRINEFIGLLNKIPGVNLDLIGQVSIAANAAAESEAGKKARQVAINAAKANAAANSASQNAGFDWDSLTNGVGNTAENTAKMADSMDMADESLQYMRDLAEQEAVNKYTTASVSVDFGGITNHVNSELDLDGVVDYIATKTTEAMEIAAEGIHR